MAQPRPEGSGLEIHVDGIPWPDVPGLGERKDVPAVTQSQIAATAAALLGEDYVAEVPKAGKPIAAVLGR